MGSFDPGRTALCVTGAIAAVGASCLGYAALYEVRAFVLRRVTLPVLPLGAVPIRVLQLSDMHLTPHRRETVEWVRSLVSERPDIVVNTGDNLAHVDAPAVALEAMEPLLAVPGVFVFGSNDYAAPIFRNPAEYLIRPSSQRSHGARIDAEGFAADLTGAGWVDLRNRRTTITVRGSRVELVGVDDPHIGRDRYDGVPADPSAGLTIGVSHAPYLRTLDAMTADGARLLVMGHTHGGQLNVPFYGPIVSNCDLPPRYAKGCHRWRAEGNTAWLNVSAGLGTNPYTPVRFCCRPEATLLTLTSAQTSKTTTSMEY